MRRITLASILALALLLAACYHQGNSGGGTPPTSDNQEPPKAEEKKVTFYLLALYSGSGPIPKDSIGCGDQLIAVDKTVKTTETDFLKTALTELFAVKGNYGQSGLTTALDQSSLSVQKISVENEKTIVELSGNILSGGVCDDPRIKGQVEATVKHYAKNFEIRLNGKESAWRCFGNLSGLCK